MPLPESDPRVFFAAERTLLAWLRTGLTIIGLGFVVSRFGLFLQLLGLQTHGTAPHAGLSALLGGGFVGIGTLAILAAARQHRRFVATLARSDLPRAYAGGLALWLALVVGALGALLTVYLFLSQP